MDPAALGKTEAANNDRFIAKNDRFIANKDLFITNKDRFIVNKDRFIANKDRFIANKHWFIAYKSLRRLKVESLNSKEVGRIRPGPPWLKCGKKDLNRR